jgi:oligoribonuclease
MSTKQNDTKNLVWIDMEMTGLDPETDEILEIAVLITDSELNEIARGPNLILQQKAERFARMDAWNQEHHSKSGLWQAALESKVTLEQAEQEVLRFVKLWVGERKSPLCGNSVWQDRRFLCRYMRQLEAYLHYRLIDVSTIKELYRLWYPQTSEAVKKNSAHRAMDDIVESVDELRYYRQLLFPKQLDSGAPL